MLQILFEEQLHHKELHGHFRVDKYMPPVSGSLRWTKTLYQRTNNYVLFFSSLQHP